MVDEPAGVVRKLPGDAHERLIERDCEHCGRRFELAKTGRPSRYCSPNCQQRVRELRRAAARDLARCAHERLIERDCEHCGRRFELAKTGRPPRYCSRSCRQRAWELRRATAALAQPDPRPEVIRETVRVPIAPNTPREWCALLDRLISELDDPGSDVATRHYDHRRLYDRFVALFNALDAATPGGLGTLERQH